MVTINKAVVVKVFDKLGLGRINMGNEAWDDYRLSKYMSCGVAKVTLSRKNKN